MSKFEKGEKLGKLTDGDPDRQKLPHNSMSCLKTDV